MALALTSCSQLYSLLGIKGTLSIQNVTINYDTTGGTGVSSITLSVQNSGPADVSNVYYEVILNAHTTYDSSSPVVYKGQASGSISNGGSQTFTINASDLYTYVANSSNQVSALDNQYYVGGVVYSQDDPANTVSYISQNPIWWINNTFAFKAASGQLTASPNPLPNSSIKTLVTGHYNVYVGLIDPNSPLFVNNNANLNLTPAQIFSGAWNVYSVNYNSGSGFTTPINFTVGTPDSTHYQYYMGAFIDVNGDGKLAFSSSGSVAEPAVNYTAAGGSPSQGDLLSLGSDQTGLNFSF